MIFNLKCFGSVLLAASLSFAVVSCNKDSRLVIEEPVAEELSDADFAVLTKDIPEIEHSEDFSVEELLAALISSLGLDYDNFLVFMDKAAQLFKDAQIEPVSNGFRAIFENKFYIEFTADLSVPAVYAEYGTASGSVDTVFAVATYKLDMSSDPLLVAEILFENTAAFNFTFDIHNQEVISNDFTYDNGSTKFVIEDINEFIEIFQEIEANYKQSSLNAVEAFGLANNFNLKFHMIGNPGVYAQLAGKDFYATSNSTVVRFNYGGQILTYPQVSSLFLGFVSELSHSLSPWIPQGAVYILP